MEEIDKLTSNIHSYAMDSKSLISDAVITLQRLSALEAKRWALEREYISKVRELLTSLSTNQRIEKILSGPLNTQEDDPITKQEYDESRECAICDAKFDMQVEEAKIEDRLPSDWDSK